MSSDDDLKAEVERARERVRSEQARELPRVDQVVRQPIPMATARFHITRWVVWAYLAYGIGVGAFIMFGGDGAKSAVLIDMMKSLFLPLVTLVIGFYFGRAE
jgi:hypothetical protein